jgi:hypothetical protein
MITEKIDMYLDEAVKKADKGDELRFQKIFQRPPKKTVTWISFTFFKDYTADERVVDYMPTKNGFQFEYNLDFDPEFSETLSFLADSYGMAWKSNMERHTNTSIFTVTYKGKKKR